MRLSIDPNIVSNWDFWDAIREIIQGALDSGEKYSINYKNETLTIENKGKLERQTLLVGNSSKRDNPNTIGKHGEGYKLAIAVLLRLEKRFHIYNNNEFWKFSYKWDRRFKCNVIDVDIKKFFIEKINVIRWEIKDIKQEEYESVISKFKKEGDLKGSNGWILIDKPGEIFSGGLYVCKNENLKYGYNFNVGVLDLHRDRNLISDFDIFWETSKCWSEYPNDIATMLRDNIIDVKYCESAINDEFFGKDSKVEKIRNSACETFYKQYGYDANPCSTESDKIEGANNVIVSSEYKTAIRKSKNYKETPLKQPKLTPYQILNKWYEKENIASETFENILEISKTWKN